MFEAVQKATAVAENAKRLTITADDVRFALEGSMAVHPMAAASGRV